MPRAIYKFLTETMGLRGEATIHGFRSSFRTWAGDETHFDRVSVELCLAHKAGDDTELAYRRSDSLEKRRAVMESWGQYCCGGGGSVPVPANQNEAKRKVEQA
jgi:integrase